MYKESQVGQIKKWHVLILIGIISVLLSLGGYLYYLSEEKSIRQFRYDEIKAIAELKVEQITEWYKQRLGDAKVFYGSPLFANEVNIWLQKKQSLIVHQLKERLSLSKKDYGYEDIFLISPEGKILLNLNPSDGFIDPVTISFIHKASKERKVIFSDFYFCPTHEKIHYDIFVPIVDDKNVLLSVLILRVDPFQYLYPLIQTWPTSSKTSETFIVRKEGDSVLILNELRHIKKAALTLRFPLSQKTLLVVQAVLGHKGIMEGRDYLGKQVLAYMQPIPGTPWFMVSKVGTAEIFSELKYRAIFISCFTIVLILLSSAGIAYIFYARQRNIYRELFFKEKKLRELNEEYKSILYSIGDGVITTDTNGNVEKMNSIAEALTGWEKTEAEGKPLIDIFNIVNEESRYKVENPVDIVLKKGVIVGLANHTLLISKDGREIPIADSGAPINDEDGNTIGVVLVFHDLSLERKAQRELADSEKKFRLTFELGSVGSTLTALDGSFIAVNDAYAKMLGYSKDELVSISYIKITHPDDIELSKEIVRSILAGEKESCSFEKRYIRKDGRIIWVDINVMLLKDSDGKPVHFITNVIDITERILAAKALKENHERLLKAEHIASMGFLDWDLKTNNIVLSEEICSLYGLNPQKTFTTPELVAKVVHPDDVEYVQKNLELAIRREKDYAIDHRIVLPDGKIIWVHSQAELIRDNNGIPTSLLGTSIDITWRKQIEEDLITAKEKAEQSDKLKSEFLAQMSHEIRTPLHIILGNVIFLEEDMERDITLEVQECFDSIDYAARRIIRTVNMILDMSELQVGSYNFKSAIIDLHSQVLKKLISEFRLIANNKGIELNYISSVAVPKVNADEYSIIQIFINLIDNAIKYTKEGKVEILLTRNNEGNIIVEIKDTGIGISKEFIPHLFEPFVQEEQGYTRSYEGNGLGLALVKKYCGLNDLNLEVESEKNVGSTFRVIFKKKE
ncbi:MAG: PAS domain S-box protein [Bacteroidota bacterium]